MVQHVYGGIRRLNNPYKDYSNEEILEAHHAQTKLLQDYASGVEIKIEIIMVHAQDHLMTTMTLLEVAKEMLVLHRKVG